MGLNFEPVLRAGVFRRSPTIAAAGLLIFSFVSLAHAQNSNVPANAASNNGTAAIASPTPITPAVIISESDRALARVREIDAFLHEQSIPKSIAEGLDSTRADVAERSAATSASIEAGLTLETIARAERNWTTIESRVRGWVARIQSQATAIEELIAELKSMQDRWSAASAAISLEQEGRSPGSDEALPDELLSRTAGVLSAVTEADRFAVRKRAEVLLVDAHLSEIQSEVESVLSLLKLERERELGSIFFRNDRALWEVDHSGLSRGSLFEASSASLQEQWLDLKAYTARNSSRFVFHGAFLGLIIGLLFWTRRKIMLFVEKEPQLGRPAAFFKFPVASALVVSAFFAGFIYPQAPKLLNNMIGAAAIIPGFLILRRIIESPLNYLLYGLLGIYIVDRVRDLLVDVALVSRILFSIELLAAASMLIWFYRSRWVEKNVEAGAFSAFQRVRRAMPFAAAIFIVAFFANVFGFVSLSYLVGNGLLRAAYLTVFLYTAVQILASAFAFLLRGWPLTLLRAVRHNRTLIRQRATRMITWAAVLLWMIGVLNIFSIHDVVYGAVASVITYGLSIGEITFSVGDILLFVGVVWVAVLVSRLVRFILEEDVYPRLDLGGGASYSISSVFHYLLLIAAFFFAVSAVGFELSRFAFVAGAVGLGLGFGLQNIINNFVSGLILLFEQPVKVGDTVQIGEHMGSLKSIGLRASVVRKVDGSDVIVPNSQLISEEVVNWTMLDERRRIDIPVGVAYGTNAEAVKSLLIGIAGRYDLILADPAPRALFVGLGESSLDFELRVWTDDTDGWVSLRSDLVTDVYDSLNAAGIEIPYPQRDIHIRKDGGQESE